MRPASGIPGVSGKISVNNIGKLLLKNVSNLEVQFLPQRQLLVLKIKFYRDCYFANSRY